MPGLADQINDGPVILPALEMRDIQFCRLFPAQPATQEQPEQCSASLCRERIRVRHQPERSCLVGREPVTKTNAEVFRSLDSTDASSEVGAEQAGISCLVREPPDGRESAVNRARRKLTGFQMNAI